LSIHEDGTNESEDATLSARNALLAMIDVLVERGWTVSRPTRHANILIAMVEIDRRVGPGRIPWPRYRSR
jgi:hypothetical protein